MTIDVGRNTERLIEREVQAGRFRDAASLVDAAFRHLLLTREDIGYTRLEIDAMLADATSSL